MHTVGIQSILNYKAYHAWYKALLFPSDEGTDHASLHHLLGLNKPLDALEAQESLKAKVNAIRKKLVQQVDVDAIFVCPCNGLN